MVRKVSFPWKKGCPHYVGMSSRGKHLSPRAKLGWQTMQRGLEDAISFSFSFCSCNRKGNRLFLSSLVCSPNGDQSGARCGAGCPRHLGDMQSCGRARTVAHRQHSAPFALKAGSRGVRGGRPYSVSSPFGARGGIPKEAPSSLALADPASTICDPGMVGSRKGGGVQGGGFGGLALTFRTVTHVHK